MSNYSPLLNFFLLDYLLTSHLYLFTCPSYSTSPYRIYPACCILYLFISLFLHQTSLLPFSLSLHLRRSFVFFAFLPSIFLSSCFFIFFFIQCVLLSVFFLYLFLYFLSYSFYLLSPPLPSSPSLFTSNRYLHLYFLSPSFLLSLSSISLPSCLLLAPCTAQPFLPPQVTATSPLAR